jgi:starch-binding outer membrane protein SusE/F
MKNITKSLIGLFAVFAFSCTPSDIQDRPEVTTTDTPVLTGPQSGAIYELKQANAALQAERFTWSSANFGEAKVTYTVEIDTKTNNFAGTAAFKNLGSVEAENQLSVSVATMAEVALSLGATPYTPSEFVVRIKAAAGTAPVMLSNVIGIVINPYTNELPKLWLPGGYQVASGYGADWAPSSAPQIASSGYGKTDFEGYVYINTTAAEFKFTPQGTGFEGDYGDAVGPNGVYSGKLLQTDEKNAGTPTAKAAYYWIKADTDPEKLTYTLTETVWGFVGDATPGSWPDNDNNTVDNDSMMSYNKDTKVWTLTLNLNAGALKFRANKAWDINYGDTGVDGKLELNGDNITVAVAGNYTITLDLSHPRAYTYTMVKN